MMFEVYCDESQHDLSAKSGEEQPGQQVALSEIQTEVDARFDLKAEIEEGASSRPRRIAVVLAALLIFSFLSALGQQQPCDALAAAIDDTIQVSGTVASPVERSPEGRWAWFYVSGGGCSIRVYYGSGNLPWLAEGSRILIMGYRSEFNNEPQITAESVGLMESSAASDNRLLLIVLVISGVALSAAGILIARLRRRLASGDKTPRPRPDAKPSEEDLISAEMHERLDERLARESAACSMHESGQVLHEQEQSREKASIARLRRIKREHPRAYERWSTEEDERLAELTQLGDSVRQIATALERQPGAIRARLKKLDQGDELLHLPNDSENLDEAPIAERFCAVRRGEIAFLPLAVSSMSADAVCVAGLDINKRSWVRLVRRGMYSLKEADSVVFRDRSLMGVRVGAPQVRPVRIDPRGLHTEDSVIEGKPRKLASLDPGDKLALLESAVDEDLERALSTKRSLFVVEPSRVRLIPRDGKQPKIAFETPTTSTNALRSSQILDRNLIGISSQGCPCNCLAWDQAPESLSRVRTHIDIRELCPGARVFLALSLTGWPLTLPTEKQKHYLLVAGIHVIGRNRVWL
jgi:hypothetical protein